MVIMLYGDGRNRRYSRDWKCAFIYGYVVIWLSVYCVERNLHDTGITERGFLRFRRFFNLTLPVKKQKTKSPITVVSGLAVWIAGIETVISITV